MKIENITKEWLIKEIKKILAQYLDLKDYKVFLKLYKKLPETLERLLLLKRKIVSI